MTTLSILRVMVSWLACFTPLVVTAVNSTRADEGERHVILVNVLDREGNPVPGLSAANFRGEFRGKPVTVVTAIPEKAARRIAVVVDASGSQGGAPAWKVAEDLVEDLVPPNSAVILTMAATLQKHSELTSDRPALEQAIREALAKKGEGSSAVYDGALQASLGFASPAVGDVVCLVTDGVDSSSTHDSDAVITAVAQRGVRVFAVRLKTSRPAGMGYQYATRWIEAITKATGGEHYSQEEFQRERTRRTIPAMIREGYRLEVQLPQAAGNARQWKLEIIDAHGKKLPNVRLVYPQLIPPVVSPQ